MLDLFLFFLVGIKKWRIFESDFHDFINIEEYGKKKDIKKCLTLYEL